MSDTSLPVSYRLVAATGREHVSSAATQTTWDDASRVGLPLPSDGQAMQNYTESYAYDPADNLQSVTHASAAGSWARTYAYVPPAVPPAGNRLTSTTVGSTTEAYVYDGNGNVIGMPHLSLIAWDFKNMLQATASQIVTTAAPPTTYYAYDQTGARVRKATTSSGGGLVSERLYVGPYEIYREYSPAGAVTLERQSLHVSDGARRICLIETTTVDATPVTATTGPVATPSSASGDGSPPVPRRKRPVAARR